MVASRSLPSKDPAVVKVLNFFDELFVQLKTKHNGSSQIEEDREIRAQCQAPAPWALASIASQASLLKYPYKTPQRQTEVVILDTWIDIDHPELEGRARRGPAFLNGTSEWHGTHVAGIIGSKTYGVNKNATMLSIQVLDGTGTGSWSVLLTALEWIGKNLRPSIINMSIGGPKSDIVNAALNVLVRHGWKVVVAAGNESQDACDTTPAGASDVIAVGAYDVNNTWASFSNYGPCVNMLAPGVDVLSLYPNGGLAFASGTSMASPMVAGLWSLVPAMAAQEFLTMMGETCIIKNVPPHTSNIMASCAKGGLCNEPCPSAMSLDDCCRQCPSLMCTLRL